MLVQYTVLYTYSCIMASVIHTFAPLCSFPLDFKSHNHCRLAEQKERAASPRPSLPLTFVAPRARDSSLRGDRLGDRYSLFIWRSPVARAAVRSSAPLDSSRYSAAPLIYLSRVQRLPSTRRGNANKRTRTQVTHNRCSLFALHTLFSLVSHSHSLPN